MFFSKKQKEVPTPADINLTIVAGTSKDPDKEDFKKVASTDSCAHAVRLILGGRQNEKLLLEEGLNRTLDLKVGDKQVHFFVYEPRETRNTPLVGRNQTSKNKIFLFCPDSLDDFDRARTLYRGLGLKKQKDRVMLVTDTGDPNEILELLRIVSKKPYIEMVPHFWEKGLMAIYEQFVSPVKNPSKEELAEAGMDPKRDALLTKELGERMPVVLIEIIKNYMASDLADRYFYKPRP